MNKTHNNDFAYENSGGCLLEFFSKAGSLFEKKESYYGDSYNALDLFKPAWASDREKAVQLLFWLRDIRGGAGNRSGFRSILRWLAKDEEGQKWVKTNLILVPEHGRWDDLICLFDTPCEKDAIDLWICGITNENQLASKWVPRKGNVFNKLIKYMKTDPKTFRKALVESTKVVESDMCKKDWHVLNYNQVPSVAMMRYANAFKKHDSVRFEQWKKDLKEGKDSKGNVVKVNAGAIYPHDIIRKIYNESNMTFPPVTYYSCKQEPQNDDMANAAFEALPDYMKNKNIRIISICDFSGSMTTKISGDVSALHVSMGMGLYCSEKIGKANPFYRKFIPFSDNSNLVDWKSDTFSIAAQKYCDGYVGSTNITAALNQILDAAKLLNATNEQIPNCLLIISDMQFDEHGNENSEETAIESCMKKWKEEGYDVPKIIYWNTDGYRNSPAQMTNKNVGLVSGFSPSILESILVGEDFSPMAILERAIVKYKIQHP